MTVEPDRRTGTDRAWEDWGRRDPYFAVITDPKFRRSEMTPDAKREFFDSGQLHVDNLLRSIRRHFQRDFSPARVLEFGCGVGRLILPIARVADEVIGLDVSVAMLAEARRNCEEHQLKNVTLMMCDDTLSNLTGSFDLIHSFITFQHMAPERGREILGRLLEHLGPLGIASLHFSYSKSHFAAHHGLPPPPPVPERRLFRRPKAVEMAPSPDPEMQMNPYNVNELLFLIQRSGVKQYYAEFTDHGGELGIVLYFQRF